MRIPALLLLSAISLAAPGNSYADAENLNQAFGIVTTARMTNNYMRLRCADWYPDIKSTIDRHYYSWETANADEIAAIDRLSETYPPDYVARLTGTTAITMVSSFDELVSRYSDRRTFCNHAASQMTGNYGEIRARTPMASALLLEYLKDNPLSDLESHDRAAEIGCVEHGLNSGGDLDELLAYCGCTTDTMVEGMSETERAEYHRTLISGDASAARALPQFQALELQLEGCRPSPTGAE